MLLRIVIWMARKTGLQVNATLSVLQHSIIGLLQSRQPSCNFGELVLRYHSANLLSLIGDHYISRTVTICVSYLIPDIEYPRDLEEKDVEAHTERRPSPP